MNEAAEGEVGKKLLADNGTNRNELSLLPNAAARVLRVFRLVLLTAKMNILIGHWNGAKPLVAVARAHRARPTTTPSAGLRVYVHKMLGSPFASPIVRRAAPL